MDLKRVYRHSTGFGWIELARSITLPWGKSRELGMRGAESVSYLPPFNLVPPLAEEHLLVK